MHPDDIQRISWRKRVLGLPRMPGFFSDLYFVKSRKSQNQSNTRTLKKKLTETHQWDSIVNTSNDIAGLYKLSVEARSVGDFCSAFIAPFQCIFVGEPGGCKSSVAWGVEIAESGWHPPKEVRVRDPMDDGFGAGTEDAGEFCVKATQEKNFCKIVDVAGMRPPQKFAEPHQFVVLVMEASRVFERDGAIKSSFREQVHLGTVPYLDDAEMILLTKWDMLLYEAPVNEPLALMKRLDEMWEDREKLDDMRRFRGKLRELVHYRDVIVRCHRTSIFIPDATPSLKHVQEIQNITVRMLEELLRRVRTRFTNQLRDADIKC